MSQENVEMLRAVYDCWARGDFWTPEAFDPEVESVWPAEVPDVGTYYGLEGLAQGTREFLTAWDSVSFEPDKFIDLGSRVLVLFTVRGRGKGSSVETEGRYAHVWTMRDAKAIRVEAFSDWDTALKAVGLEE